MEQTFTYEVSLLPPLENVKPWVSFQNICPASSSFCTCYDWVVLILMMGGILLLCNIQQWTQQSLSALTIDWSVSPVTLISYISKYLQFLILHRFPDMRNEWITSLFLGKKSGTTVPQLMSEAVDAEGQISMLPTAGGHFGQSPSTQVWSKQPRCSCRAQLLLYFTQKGDTLLALRLPCMVGGGDLLKLQSHGQTTVVMLTHSH